MNIVIGVLALVTICSLLYTNKKLKDSHKIINEVEYIDSTNTYNKIFYEKTFKELKKENKELYDSLKEYKDQISYLVQFTHEKEYNTGVIQTKTNTKDSIVYDTVKVYRDAKTYEYTSEPNDTFQYNLKINSSAEPNWYSLNAKVRNKFTIVNKEDGDVNHVTIQPNDGGTVSNVTVFKKKDGRKFWDRMSIGPGITAGYDPINHNYGVVVGITASFDLK